MPPAACASLIMKETDQGHECVIETVVGLLLAGKSRTGRITADMGEPKSAGEIFRSRKKRDTLHLGIGEGKIKDPVGVNVGNPHAVFLSTMSAASMFKALAHVLKRINYFRIKLTLSSFR